jgi:penicillin G amidase
MSGRLVAVSRAPDPLPDGRGAIFRDEWGLPHLWAATVDDLAYVQGFEAASERAWQLELGRWRAEGRSAAALGAPALAWDVFARRARLADTAQRAFAQLNARTRAWCTAYVEGVNDGLPAGAEASAEFSALGLAPGRWHSWSPLAVFAGIHVLFGTCQYKLWREHVSTTLGPELVDLFALDGEPTGGSNAYAVTGANSPTGLPVLAGDPHRTLEAPNVYQQVRLACPDFDVAGLAFPGVPGVPHFGHAGSVAWATTNAMADYQDLFIEHLRPGRPGSLPEALGPAGWEPVLHHQLEQVQVRDQPPIEVSVTETRRGPVVVITGPDRARGADSPAGAEPGYSLRTPSRVEVDLGFQALLPLLYARTVADVEAAMMGWVEPVNTLIIADRSGLLRERVVGRVPDRSAANHLRPVAADDPKAVWTGGYYKPRARDGALVVNANDRASGGGLGLDYAPPHRARRIRSLVESGAARGAGGLGSVSLDTHQPATATAHRLLRSSDPNQLSAGAAAVRGQILAWDGRADIASPGAAVFAAWRAAVVAWLLDQPALQPLLAQAPQRPELFARWTDPVIRVGAAWERLLTDAARLGLSTMAGVAAALEQVAARPPDRTWGASHLFHPAHPLAGRPGGPQLPPVPLAGDQGCVLATRSYPGRSDACDFGPVARYTWDLADRDRSRWVVPLGASWRSGSPHRDDQLKLWSRGESVPLVSAWDRLRLDHTLPAATHPRNPSARAPRR